MAIHWNDRKPWLSITIVIDIAFLTSPLHRIK